MPETEVVFDGISYIVPAYNEEGMIEKTILRLDAVLADCGHPYEIVVVDDGSRDSTREKALATGKCAVFSHPVNTGYGSAIKTGIRHSSYDLIGIVDADDTYDIERLPDLVAEAEKGFDMVVAERENVLAMDRPLKRMARSILLGFLRVYIARRIRDPNSGFRLFRRSLALAYYPFLCNTFSFTTSITLFALGDGYFVKYVPMQYGKREGKSKVRHVRDSIRMAQLIIQGVTFANPLKLFILLAFMHIALVAVPAGLLYALGASIFANLLFWTGSVAVVLGGLGVTADMIRLNSIQRSIEDFK